MIEDLELRELFQTECEEHLQTLDDGLLRLDGNPQDSATIEEAFRAAHSLKGTARMLGVTDVETLAHHLEDELGAAKRGRGILTSSAIDRMYAGVDAMRELVVEAVTGVAAGVDVGHVLNQLKGSAPLNLSRSSSNVKDGGDDDSVIDDRAIKATGDTPGIADKEEPNGSTNVGAMGTYAEPIQGLEDTHKFARHAAEYEEITQFPDSTLGESPPSESQLAAVSKVDFKIQTMRVPPARLDALMTLASELTVTTNRVNRGLAAFTQINELWEEWNKDASIRRTHFHRTSSAPVAEAVFREMTDFQENEQERLARLRVLLEYVQQSVYQDVTRLHSVASGLEESIRNVRLLPLSTIFNLFPRSVRDLARDQNKEVQFIVEGGDTTADKRILEELKDPLMHMVRNAVDHGIEAPDERQRRGKPRQATMRLRARQTAINVIVELQDDGRGLDLEAIKRTAVKRHLHTENELAAMTPEQIQSLIFAPGFSTSSLVTDVSGRGVGLDVARINIEKLKGSVQIQSVPGAGCTFVIYLPLTLATSRVLLISVASRPYAVPIEFVQNIVRISPTQFFTIEGRETFVLEEEAISLARLAQLLELDTPARTKNNQDTAQLCVVLSVGNEKLGVLVDELLDEQEVVLKPLGPMLKRVRNVSGAAILGAGEVCMVLNPHDLIKSARKNRGSSTPALNAPEAPAQRRKLILLAEDSITTRTQEKRILESAGYDVVTAVDGADAFQKLPTREFDAVVSDVEMPNMTGLALAEKIRQNNKYKELPIILVTSLSSDADKQRGIEVGANAYITKGTFEQKVLLDTLGRLV